MVGEDHENAGSPGDRTASSVRGLSGSKLLPDVGLLLRSLILEDIDVVNAGLTGKANLLS